MKTVGGQDYSAGLLLLLSLFSLFYRVGLLGPFCGRNDGQDYRAGLLFWKQGVPVRVRILKNKSHPY
jgi:hypothetical protein